jgi:hypothetical protein
MPPAEHMPEWGQHENDPSIQPDTIGYTDREPPPISIFCRTVNPVGMMHLNVWPRRGYVKTKDGLQPTRAWFYALNTIVTQSIIHVGDVDKHERVHIAGGTQRAVVLTRPKVDPSISDMGTILRPMAYVSPNVRSTDPAKRSQLWSDGENPKNSEVKDRIELEEVRGPIRREPMAGIPMPVHMYEKLRVNGVQAVAFDETIARICVVAKDDQTIFVSDYSKAPNENIFRPNELACNQHRARFDLYPEPLDSD